MKVKLDENTGQRGLALLRESGHDVLTVREQNMSGAPDTNLAEVCASERRCLVTFDLDFSNPLQFDPRHHSGIAVLRLPHPVSYSDIERALRSLMKETEEDILTVNFGSWN